jgi:hypothetical protein
MAHIHHCKICNEQVAICSDDSCLDPGHPNAGEHYCSVHHPDPAHHVEPTPPLARPISVRVEKD